MVAKGQEVEDAPLPLIYEALSSVMGEVTAVGKDSRNAQQGFNFRGIDAILNMVAPALRNHNVTVVPIVEAKEYEVVSTKAGGTQGHAVLTVRYRFIAVDGSFVETVVYGEAMDSGDKTYSKAMSVAFRTALIQCLAIPTNDRDPDEDSVQRADQIVKVDATGEDIQRIRKMVKESTNEGDLKNAGYEMAKFNVTQPDTDLILGEYREKKAEIDRIMSGDAWKTDGAKTTPAPNQQIAVAGTPGDEFKIEAFATSPGQIETLRAAQTDLLGAPDMPAILKIVTRHVASADIGFPSVEDNEMTTLRLTFDHLPMVLASKVGAKQEVASV